MEKIKIRQDKLNSFLELKKHKYDFDLYKKRNTEITRNLDILMEHLKESLKLRKNILITDDFTVEEYNHTLNYMNLLLNEEYEKMTKYKIIKN